MRLDSLLQAGEQPLRVIVSHGTVRLKGAIVDQYEHDTILQIVKQGSGTNRVEDTLKVMRPQARRQEAAYRQEAWSFEGKY